MGILLTWKPRISVAFSFRTLVLMLCPVLGKKIQPSPAQPDFSSTPLFSATDREFIWDVVVQLTEYGHGKREIETQVCN
ncbi:hypothetical protein F4809DRAFT_623873 [Biscogniauxia mediterranea]|nr:hypothetical protein F4809DRAFT_623873 [Biscogniauxia mediterranea]